MKRIFLSIVLFSIAAPAFSQQAADVLRYSFLSPGGTARFLGAGGAFTALGADFSTLSHNPAGLALFRSDELVFTPAIKFTGSESTLAGAGNATLSDDKSNFHIDNFGLVFNTTPRNGLWRTFNVGLGFNRLNNFHQTYYYQGNADGSIVNGWFNEAEPIMNEGGTAAAETLYPFGAKLAWDAGAIYFNDDVPPLYSDFQLTPNANIVHTQTLATSGSMNEMVISFAGNYDEKLMVGATIGVPFVNYRLEGEYLEDDPNDNVEFFDNLSYRETLRTQGIGINFKMGLIYRPSQAVRFGMAFHTPTLLGLTDNFDNSLAYTYRLSNGQSFTSEAASPLGLGTTDYRLRTPWRAMIGGAVLVQQHGFVSADVEWVDYGSNRYNLTADVSNPQNEADERLLNREIKNAYQQALNVRLGGELALDNIRLRAGYNLIGRPYEGDTDFSKAWSVGAGIREASFYVDLGFRHTSGQGEISAYENAPVASTENTANDFLLTVGFKF